MNTADKWEEKRQYVFYRQVHRYEGAGMSLILVSDTQKVRKYDDESSVNGVVVKKIVFESW